jgi:TPR repeat protein
MYEQGKGVKQDAQDQGDARSATRLGTMLFHGDGIGRDLQQVVKLWTLAASRGDAYAQFDLAELYLTGTGVPRDLAKAYSLLVLPEKRWM